MKKAIGKRILASILALTFMITTSMTVMFTNAETIDEDLVVHVSRSVSQNIVELDLENPQDNLITVDYLVEFSSIEAAELQGEASDKEIVLVIDTSGSMNDNLSGNSGGESRLSLVKGAANDFLAKLKNDFKAKVAIVDYNSKAYVYSEDDPLKIVNLHYSNLQEHINSLVPGGGTNIGDALRRANYILENGNPEAEQYVIMMTDGEATALSITKTKLFETKKHQTSLGIYYSDYGKESVEVASIHSFKYLTDPGSPEKYYVNYSGTGDYNNHARIYAYQMAKEFAETGVKSHYIAFSEVTAKNELSVMAKKAKGQFYETYDEVGLDNIYNNIADEIVTQLSINDVRFEEVLPDGLEFVSGSQGISNDGNVVYKDFGNIVFELNDAGTHYVAQPLTFSIVVAPTRLGTFILGQNNSSGLHYTDVKGNSSDKYFDAKTINVNETTDPNLRPDTVLDILEVQPGRVFELNKTMLESRFERLSVNLKQMSMTEFVGNIEAINGKYDIVYIGAIENYSNYQINGLGNNSIVTDIDITNRKAEDVVEFAKSGQLLILDNGIFNVSDSKLKANFYELDVASNVHEVSSINDAVLSDIETWYNQSAQRPRLSVLEQPKAYDGTKASYSEDHLMSFLYTAFNSDDHPMDLYLSIDLNGDGIFSYNEKVLKNDISINMSGLGFNYSIEDTFNGLMPWKIELVDADTNAKDYLTGFTAYSGDKTIVNVLQLSPGDDKMNIDSSAFVKPLNTEDYEIIITYMQIKDFNEAYSNWENSDEEYPSNVNGVPTVINGNYDMIIFGFGDSFSGKVKGVKSNKDLTSQAAIEAIDSFIQTGQSILFTHDTAGPQDYTNNDDMRNKNQSYNDYVNYDDAPNITANFKDDMGFSNTRTYAGMKIWRAWNSTEAYKLNEGLITMYPYVLANNMTRTLDIATTHDQYWEIDLEGENVVPWFTLDAGDLKYYPAAYYYTFSNGNITYSGTGHSTPKGIGEQEFFVNTMLKASRGANHAPTMEIIDLYEGMNIKPSQKSIDFKMTIHDIDLQDTVFSAKIYTVVDNQEVLARLMNNVSKDELLDMMFEKPPVLDEDVTEFIIRVIVEDKHGAQEIQEFNVTHKEVPGLTITDNSDDGYLVGDTIDLSYEISTSVEADKELIKNIELEVTVDDTNVSVTESSDFTKMAGKYLAEPVFDNVETPYDESNTEFDFTLSAIGVGTSNLSISSRYDVVFSEGGDTLNDEVYEKVTPINVKKGVINVEVTDNLGRVVEGATISIVNSAGIEVKSGKTNGTGVYKASTLKTDGYTVTILNLPPDYEELAISSQTVVLNYNNSSIDVKFSARDNTAPIIETQFNRTLTLTGDEEINRPIHVKVDGVKSKIVATYFKKLGEDVYTASAEDFEGSKATDNEALTAYSMSNTEEELKSTPFTLDSEKEKGIEVAQYITVSENGYYAIYAINEAGNTTVEVIYINTIIKELPDSI